MTLLLVLIFGPLAAARVSRLVTTDDLLRGPRRWVVTRAYLRAGYDPGGALLRAVHDDPEGTVRADSRPPLLAKLVTCDRCVSLWCGGVGGVLWGVSPVATVWVSVIGGTSFVAGWLCTVVDRD